MADAQRAVLRDGAALTPQTILCGIERLSPAGTFVEAATSQSRRALCDSGRQRSKRRQKKLELLIVCIEGSRRKIIKK